MTNQSRRGFLRRTLGACWTGASLLEQAAFRANHARAQAMEGLPTLFDIEKVADGVYAAIARPEPLLNCNAAIFENSADLLIVDTHSKPSAVTALVSQIRREITKKPVRYVVNSHFHWDHTQGTSSYKKIAPHADVVASEATRNLLSANGVERLKKSAEETAKSLESYKEKLGASKDPQEKAALQRLVRDSSAYLAEMRNYTPELPNVTFDRDLIIHDKSHDLHLAFRGRAHTSGDVMVFCPQKKVIATGDALHGFTPFIADGYPSEWQTTLLHFAEFPFEHVIGGHAAVQHTRKRLYQMGNYITELTDLVSRNKKGHKTLEQIQQLVTPDKLKSLADDGYGKFMQDSRIRYQVAIPGEDTSTLLASAVRTNIAEIFAALERT
jgi:glyoxylase-like metal-dependent hydrolase (beta-lactamase superfamily II)